MKKVAVLMAAGSGMGADAAKKLKSDGFKIAIMSSSERGQKLAKKLNGIGFRGSNQNIRNIEQFFELVLKKLNRIDVLVNSAGHGPKGEILKFGQYKIILNTKEEVISGSTRLKAGTAQKICLNTISSMVMIKMGRVQNGIMSHMVPTNEKLRQRKSRINKKL